MFKNVCFIFILLEFTVSDLTRVFLFAFFKLLFSFYFLTEVSMMVSLLRFLELSFLFDFYIAGVLIVVSPVSQLYFPDI